MTIRIKPFLVAGQRRERIVADDVRRNKAENIGMVINSFSDVIPEEREPLLVIAEALRRLGLIFDETESRVFTMPDGVVLAIARELKSRWFRTYLLDDECAPHFRVH